MYDNDMTNILKNFASAGSEGGITDAKTGEKKVNHAATEKNAMKSLLEGLDAQQKSVNQMPSTHKMGKNGTKHPASKFLVGGEFDDEREYPGPDDEYDEEEFHDGMRVELKPDYADTPGEVFTLSAWDGRKGWIGDKDGRGWGVRAHQIMPASEEMDDAKDDVGGGLFDEAELDDPFKNVHADERNPFKNVHQDEKRSAADPFKNVHADELDEAKPLTNFEPEDLQRLGAIKDLGMLKSQAIQLISKPSARPMKPEKVAWFERSIKQKTNAQAIIKLMWDLLLAGEGTGVIGSRGSMDKSSYRAKFGEDTIGQPAAPKTQMNKKQSFKDVFRSMEETEDDMSNRFKKELHDEREERILNKGKNGKFDLAEDTESEYDVEVYPPYNIALMSGGRVVAKIDIEDWKMLNRKVIKELRTKK